ncbi:MAG: hypothetical protein FD146_1018 [Anaerolineaceae bacterium]|nr:MAG: hypothetical protein FD146_1018 [Anaerolineaceae bacterium]
MQSPIAYYADVEFAPVNEIFHQRGLVECIENIFHAFPQLAGIIDNRIVCDAKTTVFKNRLDNCREFIPTICVNTLVDFPMGCGELHLYKALLDLMFILTERQGFCISPGENKAQMLQLGSHSVSAVRRARDFLAPVENDMLIGVVLIEHLSKSIAFNAYQVGWVSNFHQRLG